MSSQSETVYSGMGAIFSGINVIIASGVNMLVSMACTSSCPATVYDGIVSGITWQSGGTQLPNVPCGRWLMLSNALYISGNNITPYNVGGLGGFAPYYDTTMWPNSNTNTVNMAPQGISNLNQISVVSQHSGITGILVYTAVD